jgi:hypothetical protein
LSTDAKGSGLDTATIELLSRYGMVDIPRLVMFSQYPFSHLFGMLTTSELRGVSRNGFKNLPTYRVFIWEHDLITNNYLIQLTKVDPITYMAIQKTRRRQSSSNFLTSLQTKMDLRLRACGVGGTQKSAAEGSESPSTREGGLVSTMSNMSGSV